MKVKRYKQARKTLSFFELSFGMKAPYKVVMDAEFIATALENRVQLNEQISNFLQDDCSLFVTKCVVSDLEERAQKDKFWRGALLIAKKMKFARCNHSQLAHPHDCLKVLVNKNNTDYSKVNHNTTKNKKLKNKDNNDDKENDDDKDEETPKKGNKDNFDLNTAGKGMKKTLNFNAERWILALQHANLREELRAVPAVPFLHFVNSAIKLEEPSEATLKYANYLNFKQQFNAQPSTGLNVLKRLRSQAVTDIDISDIHKGQLQNIIGTATEEEKNRLKEKRKIEAKLAGETQKKVAKGPNPLSMKKKKKRQDPSAQGEKKKPSTETPKTDNVNDANNEANNDPNNDNTQTKRKRSRKRKSPTNDDSNDNLEDNKETNDKDTVEKPSKKIKHKQEAQKPVKLGVHTKIRTYKEAKDASRARPTVGRKAYLTVNKHNKYLQQRKDMANKAREAGIDLNDY